MPPFTDSVVFKRVRLWGKEGYVTGKPHVILFPFEGNIKCECAGNSLRISEMKET